jgi:hypothetical protein
VITLLGGINSNKTTKKIYLYIYIFLYSVEDGFFLNYYNHLIWCINSKNPPINKGVMDSSSFLGTLYELYTGTLSSYIFHTSIFKLNSQFDHYETNPLSNFSMYIFFMCVNVFLGIFRIRRTIES